MDSSPKVLQSKSVNTVENGLPSESTPVKLEEFSRHTAIPWFRLFFDPKFSYYERIFIGVILSIASVSTATLVIFLQTSSYSGSRETNIESLQQPPWHQPFPTVYVCPTNKISREEIVKQVDRWALPQNVTKKEMLEKLKKIIIGAFRMTDFKYSEIIAQTLKMNNVSLFQLMGQVIPKCEKMLVECQYAGSNYDCDKVFSRVMTMSGPCCASNIRNGQIINGTRKLKRNLKTMTISSSGNGIRFGLMINYSDGFSSFVSSQGYYIHAGSQSSHFGDGNKGLSRPLRRGTENYYSFTSTQIEKTDDVRQLKARQKGCIDSEIKLAAFPSYSKSDCRVECTMNTTLKHCQCVPMIFPKYSDDQRYCEISDLKCLESIQAIIRNINSDEFNISRYEGNKIEFEVRRPCNCYGTCEKHFSYEAAVSSSPLNLHLIEKSMAINGKKIQKLSENFTFYCSVNVYSQGSMLTKIITDVKYKRSEIVAFIGSVVSFTLGWSIICIIELLHFLLQLAINYCRNTITEASYERALHTN